MDKYHQPLLANKIYHLFSRAVGNEKIFANNDNYLYFLNRLKYHTDAVCKFYCYSLLPNHFHLLVKIEDESRLIAYFEQIKNKKFDSEFDNLSDFVMERFSNFLNGYTKAFNKMFNRKGALFMDYLKRSTVSNDNDFVNFVWYIHKNAVHHQLVKNVGEWNYDSFKSLISTLPTLLLRDELFDWFGGKKAFIEFHNQTVLPKSDFPEL